MMIKMMRNDYLRIGNVWDALTSDGVFTYLNRYNVPWKTEGIAASLDLLYHGNHGFMITSPIVDRLLTENGNLSPASKEKLAKACFDKFHKNWEEIWEVLQAEYNPIENYRMVEEGTDVDTGSITDSADHTGSDTMTNAGTVLTENSKDETVGVNSDIKTKTSGETKSDPGDVTNLRSGFNSSDYVADSKSTEAQGIVSLDPDKNYSETKGDESANFTHTTAGADENFTRVTDSTSHTQSYDSTLTSTKEFNDVTKTHNFTRSGNIGITTSQQMQQSSLELWKYNYFEQVMRDIDTVLTCRMY